MGRDLKLEQNIIENPTSIFCFSLCTMGELWHMLKPKIVIKSVQKCQEIVGKCLKSKNIIEQWVKLWHDFEPIVHIVVLLPKRFHR